MWYVHNKSEEREIACWYQRGEFSENQAQYSGSDLWLQVVAFFCFHSITIKGEIATYIHIRFLYYVSLVFPDLQNYNFVRICT